MKLLYVIHQYFPECRSGTEQYCLAMSREARRRGDEVIVLTLHGYFDWPSPPIHVFEEPYDGFRVLRLRHWERLSPNDVLRDYHNPLVAARFRQVLDDVQPDAIHFFHLRLLGADLLDIATTERQLPTAVHLMDFWYLCPRFILLRGDGSLCDGPPNDGQGCVRCVHPELSGTMDTDSVPGTLARRSAEVLPPSIHKHPWHEGARPAARYAALVTRKDRMFDRLRRVDHIIAPSQFLADRFVANGFPDDRMSVMAYGLEPHRVERRTVERPRTPLRLAFAGIFSPWKSPHVLVEAVRALPDAVLEATLHGPLDMEMFRDYIDDVRHRAGGDPRIRFAGAFDASQTSDVLAAMDVLVVPSTWYENTPFVILEAFEAGVPVIASDLGGMSELVQDGHNGFLFEPGNPQSLAAVIQRLIDSPDLVSQTAANTAPPGTIASNYDQVRPLYSRRRASGSAPTSNRRG